MFDEVIDVNKLPTLDLHGEYEVSAKILIRNFINENIILKNKYIAIIHGKSGGMMKKVTNEVLRNDRNVLEYKICYFNDGMTLVKLK